MGLQLRSLHTKNFEANSYATQYPLACDKLQLLLISYTVERAANGISTTKII